MKKLLFIIFLISFSIYAQETTIEKIIASPQAYLESAVSVKGLVIMYQRGTGNTNYYLLRGDYGGIIKVNTSEEFPEINKIYNVIGVVYFDEKTNSPFLSEKSKYLAETKEVAKESAIKKESSEEVTPVTELKTNNQFVIGLAIVLIILLSVYLFTKQKQIVKPAGVSSIDKTNKSETQLAYQYQDYEKSSEYEFKTIRITPESPKTLKFIQGKLTIISGEDKGKSFKIAGYPTSEGNIVTIGREEIRGERAYSHIQLMQKTISRKQAEIIQKDDKLYIKNLSETNPTQVNGIELKVQEKIELKPGDILRLGELELKYEL